jgi:hypothetical protein
LWAWNEYSESPTEHLQPFANIRRGQFFSVLGCFA